MTRSRACVSMGWRRVFSGVGRRGCRRRVGTVSVAYLRRGGLGGEAIGGTAAPHIESVPLCIPRGEQGGNAWV